MKRPSALRTAAWLDSVTALFDSPSWSKEQFRGFQNRALCRLVQHAYDSVPYYRRLFDREGLKPGDIRGTGDLGLIPVTQRDHLQSLPAQEVVARGYNHRNLVVRRTSGSTGAPASIRRTRPEEWLLQALRLRANIYYGGRLTGRRAAIQFRRGDDSYENSAPARPVYMKWGLLPVEVVHCLLPPDELISRLRTISPDVISGYPGTISWIAGHMSAADRACIRPRYVTVGGETVTPEMRRVAMKPQRMMSTGMELRKENLSPVVVNTTCPVAVSAPAPLSGLSTVTRVDRSSPQTKPFIILFLQCAVAVAYHEVT